MKIITGYTGQNHIEAADVQVLIQGMMGRGLLVLDTGMHFEPELVDANTVRINSGDAIFQGVHCRIPYGESDTVTIANGSADYDRTDIIALRYEKDIETGEESVSWAYYQGGSDGSEPELTDGVIEEGALVAEAAMFTFTFDRMTPGELYTPSVTYDLTEIMEKAFLAELHVQSKASESDALYKQGDTATLRYMPACGELYNNKTALRYFVPLPKPVIGAKGVTLLDGTYMVRAGGAITTPTTNLKNATKKLTLYHNGIEVLVTNTNGFGGVNHSVVAVSGNISVRFT